MSHYETLGVKPDAKPDEIKRAYRSRAGAIHPDKGGKPGEFEPVAKAYEVLSDPERRLLYDATGEDQRRPIEKEAEQLLLHIFQQALSNPDDIPLVLTVETQLKEGSKNRVPTAIKDLRERKKKLEKKRSKVTSTAPTNVVHMLIDQELKQIDAQIADFEWQLEVGKAALKVLKSYKEDWEAPKSKIDIHDELQKEIGRHFGQQFVVGGPRF